MPSARARLAYFPEQDGHDEGHARAGQEVGPSGLVGLAEIATDPVGNARDVPEGGGEAFLPQPRQRFIPTVMKMERKTPPKKPPTSGFLRTRSPELVGGRKKPKALSKGRCLSSPLFTMPIRTKLKTVRAAMKARDMTRARGKPAAEVLPGLFEDDSGEGA